MGSFLRLVALMVGFPILLYGLASLTGNWLATPPWWEREIPTMEAPGDYSRALPGFPPYPREGREWISGGVVALGLVLVAFAAVPRRAKPEATLP